MAIRAGRAADVSRIGADRVFSGQFVVTVDHSAEHK